MAPKNSTTIAFIVILLFFISLTEADLLGSPSPAANNFGSCPRNPTQLGVCANVLGLRNIVAGDTRALPCCNALNGLLNVQVADCLCFVFRPITPVYELDKAIREIFFACNMIFPIGFQCPPASTEITP